MFKYFFYSTFSKFVPPHSLHFLGLHLPSLIVPQLLHFHFAILIISYFVTFVMEKFIYYFSILHDMVLSI